MTPQEAIFYLEKVRLMRLRAYSYKERLCKATEIGMDAIIKQIPKKLNESKCPNCNTTVFCVPTGNNKVCWCCNCGQAIDWSKE